MSEMLHFVIFALVCLVAYSGASTTTTTTAPNEDLKIAAFNVQIFGRAKMSKPDVVNILVQIIQRYDIVLIQEIRDSSGESIIQLLEEVNEAGGHEYEMVISDRLGRTQSKEQYAFFFRAGIGLEVISEYQYPDPEDKFEREPYCILMKVPNRDVEKVALVAIHADPDVAQDEIDALIDVHEEVKKKWSTDNIVLMGDMNAASPYTTKREMENLKLRDSKYLWLISDDMDTTVSQSDAAYDRFVVTGTELKRNIVEGSAAVFRFNERFNLDVDQTKAVSDHFPIEFELKSGESIRLTNGAMSQRGVLHVVKHVVESFFSHHEL